MLPSSSRDLLMQPNEGSCEMESLLSSTFSPDLFVQGEELLLTSFPLKALSIILNKIITVKINGFEKFGRLLGTIYLKQDDKDININKLMIDRGYAVSFMQD